MPEFHDPDWSPVIVRTFEIPYPSLIDDDGSLMLTFNGVIPVSAVPSTVVVDPADWGRSTHARPAPPQLEAIKHAVIDGMQLTLGYVARDRTPTMRVVLRKGTLVIQCDPHKATMRQTVRVT